VRHPRFCFCEYGLADFRCNQKALTGSRQTGKGGFEKMGRHTINRRAFLRLSASAAFGAVAAACEKKPVPATPVAATAAATAGAQPLSKVAAVRGRDLRALTREALEALGGIDSVVHEGETVFIKPNMVTLPFSRSGNRFAMGECTKPEIIATVAEECLQAGATEVIIGDGSQMPTYDWNQAITLDGATNLAAEARRLSAEYDGSVRLACLDAESPEWVAVPSQTYLGEILVSSLVTGADRVISIPVAKTHAWAQLTLSLKNFVGVTPLRPYATWLEPGYWDRGKVFDHSSPEAIAKIYLDIVDAVKPDLALIDLSIGVEGDGPTVGEDNGRTVNLEDRLGSWLILASTDLVAIDSTAARVMNHKVADLQQLVMGYKMGLGEIHEEAIQLVGDRLDSLRVEWEPAKLRPTLPPDAHNPQESALVT
jgi:uncharacterized protein (DUF362 family)